MKKTTLLVAVLMWSSFLFGQTYLDEGFEGATFPPTGWTDVASATDYSNITYAANQIVASVEYVIVTSGDTDFVALGAANNNPGTVFKANSSAPGTGTGTVRGKENNWQANIYDANSGSKSAWFDDFAGDNNKWLITPAIDVTGATSLELSYAEKLVRYGSSSFDADSEVYYSTDYDGSNFATATWVSINDVKPLDSWNAKGPFSLPTTSNTIYIAFEYTGNNASDWLIDNVKVRETPSCVEPTGASFSNVGPSSAVFNWTSGPGGTETAWDIEIVDITGGDASIDDTFDGASPNTPNVTTRPYTFNSLVLANTYHVYVRAKCATDSDWSGPYSFITGIPNDECTDAINVNIDYNTVNASSATGINGTIDGATGDGSTSNCEYDSLVQNDIWYTFVAGASNVKITTTGNFDAILELFSTTDNTCATLSSGSIFCSDGTDSGSNLEEIDATGLVQGQRYYFRIYGYVNPSGRVINDFELKVWTPDGNTLGNNDIAKAEFKFYPNPVQNELHLNAQDIIENISVYNMLGQEVIRRAPKRKTAKVDMSALQTGSYFVKVTINGVSETKQIIKR